MPKKKNPNRKKVTENGPPQKFIDWERVDHLLMCGCPGTEIAASFDIHYDTFYRRVQEKYGIGYTQYSQSKRMTGHALLREVQMKKALSGDNTMMIWLGKNLLNQKENPQDLVALSEAAKNANAAATAVHEQIKAYLAEKSAQ